MFYCYMWLLLHIIIATYGYCCMWLLMDVITAAYAYMHEIIDVCGYCCMWLLLQTIIIALEGFLHEQRLEMGVILHWVGC